MRLWVMENGLLDQTGHHFNNSVGLQEECARLGVQTRFLVHRDAQPAVLEALAARAVFSFRPYNAVSQDPLAGPLENLILQGGAFADGFATAVAEGLAPEDLVFVPTTLQNELYGCALFFHRLPPERRPRLILNFMAENFFVYGTQDLGLNAPLYRYAARSLGRVAPPERLLLTANGKGMAQWLTGVLDRPVAEYPMLKTYVPQSQPSPRSGSGDGVPCVAILGHSRREKGFHLVPDLVARHPRLRFVVQVSPVEAEAQWKDARIDMGSAPNVELVRGTLDAGAYHALLARADVVLLPYDSAHLPLRTSGIFAEAVAAGKITVVPAQGWMGEHLAQGRGAGVAFAAFSVEAVSAALGQAVADLSGLCSKARSCAPAWRAQQSMDAYLRRALGDFGLTIGD